MWNATFCNVLHQTKQVVNKLSRVRRTDWKSSLILNKLKFSSRLNEKNTLTLQAYSTSVILISSENIRLNLTCRSGKGRTERTCPTAKFTSPGLSETILFAHWQRILTEKRMVEITGLGVRELSVPKSCFLGCCVYIHSRDIHSFEIHSLKVSGNENRIDWFLNWEPQRYSLDSDIKIWLRSAESR